MQRTTISTKRALFFLFSYLKKHAILVICGMLLLVAVDLCQLVIPKIIQKTLDLLSESQFTQSIILANALKILGLAAAMVLLRFFWRLCIVGPSRKIETQIRQDIFSHLMSLSFSYFNKTKTGDIMALCINDLNAIRMASGMGLIGLTDAVFMGSMSVVFMLTTNVPLTIITILPMPLIVFIMLRFGGMIQAKFKDVQESFGNISSKSQEAFSGIRVIKGFVQEEQELNDFVKACDDYVDKNMGLVKLWGFFFPIISFLACISVSLLFYFGGLSVLHGSLSLGKFMSFSFYIGLLVWPMMAIGWVFNMLQRGIASSKRIMELLETRSDVHVSAEADLLPQKNGRIAGSIRFDNCSFRYEKGSRDIISNLSLHIKQDTSCGIMGKPGSGKTTLLSLLFHLFPITENSIKIDDADINDIPLSALRSAIGYVPQDSFLFSDTIANNIAFGTIGENLVPQAIERVAKQAAIHDEILRFGNGYDTKIGERGITLSGGQKQRIAIARALLIAPRILILDDALSSVDAATEQKILTSIISATKGITSIIVAHRVSTVMHCDQIIVLDEGKIMEQGTHEQLIAAEGFYARLYHLQNLSKEKVLP